MKEFQTPVGDFHNFGAAVQKINLNGCIFYKKPRTTFWEHLFFGDSSPLKSVFENTPLHDYFCISEIIYNGEVMQKSVASANWDVTGFRFESFGFLLAYCYCMGLQDLHHNNVIFTPASNLQPIDVEVAFSGLISPSQTQLVHGSNIAFNKSALGRLIGCLENVPESRIVALIQGFYAGMHKILVCSDEILGRLPPWNELLEVYNRVIFRDTSKYFATNMDLLPEEKIQLDRGDVPYFFKVGDSESVWFFDAVDKIKAVVKLPQRFQLIANTIGQRPELILAKNRLTEKTIPLGLLSLTATFRTQLSTVSKIELGEGSLEILDKSIVFTSHNKFELRL